MDMFHKKKNQQFIGICFGILEAFDNKKKLLMQNNVFIKLLVIIFKKYKKKISKWTEKKNEIFF
jgi:hypothetical protein